ncbi:MAG TPA: carboxypeptidase regulatory-like domain-containing protein [Gemmatimonadaceae bacterium]|nr:carboxypeptidase regulatory-like domain-containing protein [Gemmatimonadaceae bacterium]
MPFRLSVAAALMTLCARSIDAQTVRGTVTDRATSALLPAVVVQLIDESGAVAVRTITDPSGNYHIAAPRAGRYRVRTLRIGFRPATSDVLMLAPGSEVNRPLVLAGVPFRLDTVRVGGRNPCEVPRDSARATFAVWEQVRTALNAAHVTAGTRAINARVVIYERALEPSRERVVRQAAGIRAGLTARPWNSLSADSLRRGGYVTVGLDGTTTYYAPDLAVLLSDQFVEDHCLRFADRSDAKQLGIEFEPSRDRRGTPDIEGTVWLDRKSGELREMTFRYVNVTREQSFGRSGGEMQFVRMKNGSFIISRWNIRMPQLDTKMVPQPGMRLGGAMQAERYVRELRIEGGELALAVLGRDTLWVRPPMIMVGKVLDSLSQAPIANAEVSVRGAGLHAVTDAKGEFRIGDALPGDYLLDIRTPDLKKLGASHRTPVSFVDPAQPLVLRAPSATLLAQSLCPSGLDGIVSGSAVISGDSFPPRNVKVVADWSEISVVSAGPPGQRGGTPTQGFLRRNRWVDARTDASGNYRLCGVPVNTAVTIRVEHDSASASPMQVRIGSDERFVRADLTLHRGLSANALLTGVVLNAGNGRPLPDVEILVSAIDRSTYTNADGAFRLGDIRPGAYQVTVRRVGYKVFTDSMEFAANQSADRTFALSAVAELAPVTTTAAPLRSFDEHRALGLGFFMTRVELEKLQGRQLSAAMYEAAGANVARGRGNQGWLTSTRVRPTGREIFGEIPPNVYIPEQQERAQGMPLACYAQVYVDNMLMNPGTPTPPFNLNEMSADRVEAIEWYSHPVHTPMKYSSRQAECGVLVIHLRRSK